jgi:hypothetical protein
VGRPILNQYIFIFCMGRLTLNYFELAFFQGEPPLR